MSSVWRTKNRSSSRMPGRTTIEPHENKFEYLENLLLIKTVYGWPDATPIEMPTTRRIRWQCRRVHSVRTDISVRTFAAETISRGAKSLSYVCTGSQTRLSDPRPTSVVTRAYVPRPFFADGSTSARNLPPSRRRRKKIILRNSRQTTDLEGGNAQALVFKTKVTTAPRKTNPFSAICVENIIVWKRNGPVATNVQLSSADSRGPEIRRAIYVHSSVDC